MYHILAIDDDLNFLDDLSSLLKFHNYVTRGINNPHKALSLLNKDKFHCVLLDVQMPGMDGISLLEQIKEKHPTIPVIMISGQSTLAIAVKAIKQGAFDFLEKGADLDRLLITLKNAIAHYNWLKERRLLINELLENYQMIGQSKAMQQIFNQIDFVAPTDSKVLITGETGTGKELIARAIQLKSNRSTRPFVRINCAAIPETLIESVFFGHKKGSFTGAIKDQPGKFELADGGTLFLDEIGELPLYAQAKLLNVLQDGEIEKIGAQKTQKVDVRIIAATNKDLMTMIKEKKFREDLFHRLNVFHIHVPPLRERIDDVPPLVEHYIKHYANELNKKIVGISPAGMNILVQYDWPGNVRMLRNVVSRAVMFAQSNIISEGEVSLALDMDRYQPLFAQNTMTLAEFLEFQERQFLRQMLILCNGNKQQMAQRLGVDRATLWRKLKRYNLSMADEQSQ
ncbi:sigma-54-dependent transcriptional regulator [Calditrichota bacterium GD2]